MIIILCMKKYGLAVVLLLLALIAIQPWNRNDGTESKHPQENASISGIGALGQIEPRSRVIRISYDSGPEGARVEKLMVKEGDLVKQGDIIAYFSDHERKISKLKAARAEVGVLEAKIRNEKANFAFVREDYARVGQLVKVKAISQKDMQEKKRNYDQSQATRDSLEAELESAKANALLAEQEILQTYVTAPITGTILKIHAWQGERIGDKGLADIADLTRLDVVAEIYERDMPRIHAGQKADIKIPGFPDMFKGEIYQPGYMVSKNDLNTTDPLADRDNRVVEVRIALPAEASEKLQHLIYMQVDVRVIE